MIWLQRMTGVALGGVVVACLGAATLAGCDETEQPTADAGSGQGSQNAPPTPPQPPEPADDAGGESNSAARGDDSGELWPRGDESMQIRQLAEHIGGFSVAMREVGYRYNELYFAGLEENWALADYHLSKLVAAIERGETRRPRRARDAEAFLDYAVPPMIEAIESEDPERFVDEFTFFADRCNDCHIDQRVPFIEITTPQHKILPWTTPGYQEE